MSDKILKALMQLFAIVANTDEVGANGREVVERFLRKQLSNNFVQQYLLAFDEFLEKLKGSKEDSRSRKKISVNSVKVLRICTDINKELEQKQKIVVLIRLLEFVNSAADSVTELHLDFIKTVADTFSISENDYNNCLAITALHLNAGPGNGDFYKIDKSHSRHHHEESFSGEIIFLAFKQEQFFIFRYDGAEQLFLNGRLVVPGSVNVFEQGSVIRNSKLSPVYYNEIVRHYLGFDDSVKINFEVEELGYTFRGNKIGLHDLTFSASSGNLVGIMGNSGAGKTTLLNLLNGSQKPTKGKIKVNGIEFHSGKNNLSGLIGNIPQDDLLIEELTVFQNLFYSSKLYFGELSDKEIEKKVDDTLRALGLFEIKDLAVGDPLNKFISGGQRKRLNIALELIREPAILFVDEPTSGLSSVDAENVMDLLKHLSLSGKLIFVVIHQPSSDIFKLFDQLLILDTGGYPVYFGNPVDALAYFKRQMNYADAENSECPECGNINSEEIFKILELKTVDEFGRVTPQRRIHSQEWYQLYNKNFVSPVTAENKAKSSFEVPKLSGVIAQYFVYFKRNLLSKLNNRQYLLITLFEAPVLALILALALRSSLPGQEYTFGNNPNIPVYIFICTIVALFLGLTVSAEEIIQDKKILKRESFLQLSRNSYLLSKISFLFLVSAIQTLIFLAVGNFILGMTDLFSHYWLVLFSTSCCANLLGLNISSGLKTRVAVYILIPFLIIPQIMLSGVMVKFEELSPLVSSQSNVPMIGNVMASRWAFEGLATDQFKNNEYEKTYFDYEKRMSNSTYRKDWWAQKMESEIYKAESLLQSHSISGDSLKKITSFFRKEFERFKHEYSSIPLKEIPADVSFSNSCRDNLDTIRKHLVRDFNDASDKKESLVEKQIEERKSSENFSAFKESHQNEKLSEIVKNLMVKDKVVLADHRIVRRFEPVFQESKEKGIFAAPFYSYSKSLFGIQMETIWFNLIILWGMTVLLYVTLYFDWLRKILER